MGPGGAAELLHTEKEPAAMVWTSVPQRPCVEGRILHLVDTLGALEGEKQVTEGVPLRGCWGPQPPLPLSAQPWGAASLHHTPHPARLPPQVCKQWGQMDRSLPTVSHNELSLFKSTDLRCVCYSSTKLANTPPTGIVP